MGEIDLNGLAVTDAIACVDSLSIDDLRAVANGDCGDLDARTVEQLLVRGAIKDSQARTYCKIFCETAQKHALQLVDDYDNSDGVIGRSVTIPTT